MPISYLIRRDTKDVSPFLEAIRAQADGERNALGFLPLPAYAEAAQQRKILLLLASDGSNLSYAGHLLFGGMFPTLQVDSDGSKQRTQTARTRDNASSSLDRSRREGELL
jgi:hypothetical protein